jgi:hypothetical protein
MTVFSNTDIAMAKPRNSWISMFRIKGILFFTFISCLISPATQGQAITSYLIEPMVQWNGNRLSGMLENASLSSVLKDLIAGRNYGCTVTGSLKGNITIRFENLTAEELIRKIMNNLRYNYSMILTGPEFIAGGIDTVSELTLYQANEMVRFVKVQKRILAPEPKRVAPVSTPEIASPNEQSIPTNHGAEEDLNRLDREIRSIMDEMVTEKKITRKEYEEALQTFRDENR